MRLENAGRIGVGALATALGLASGAVAQEALRTGADVYASACVSCHGFDGAGRLPEEVGFETPLPDFTDCSFASREPDTDWYAIVHQGGPARAFNRMMPAFGDALSADEIQAALGHVRGFCADARWPRGDLNLPLALFTEKAFPEDELVWQTYVDAEGQPEGRTELVFEKRFGPRGQLELIAPFVWSQSSGASEAGLGDVAVGWKQALIASLQSGSILSVGGEVVLPTGDESRGLGKGTTVIEPFVLFGQILPQSSFVQAHVFAEFPTESGFEDELGWRGAVGKTFAGQGGFGRTWTPMIEVLGARELVSDAKTSWDVVPEMQVSLSRRQHLLAALGARIPVTDADERDTQVVFYLLWDWYDGGLREGWR